MKRVLEAFESLNEVGMSASKDGLPSIVRYCDYVSFDVVLTNGVLFAGVFTVHGSHDGVEWFDIETESTMNLAGASDYIRLNITINNYKYLRPTITVTAGTGDVKILISGSSLSN